MKKIVIILLILTLLLMPMAQICAKSIEYFYDDEWHEYQGNVFKLEVEGEILKTEMPPIVFNNYSVVPARDVFEKLGATVNWEAETQTVTISKSDTTIEVIINSKTAYIDGKREKMPIAPKIINGKTMIPVRFVGDTLGYFVDFDSETDTVIIRKKDPDTITYITKAKYSEKGGEGTLTLITTGAEPQVTSFVLENPPRVVVDIKNGEYKPMLDNMEFADSNLTAIRFGQNDDARIVFDVNDSTEHEITKTSTKVIINIETTNKAPEPTKAPQTQKPETESDEKEDSDETQTPEPTPPPFSLSFKSTRGRDYVEVVSAKALKATRQSSPVSVTFELTGEDIPQKAWEKKASGNFVQEIEYEPLTKTKAKVTLYIKDNNFNMVQTQDSLYIMAQKAEKLRSVMIDAGHGGNDVGAVGFDEEGNIIAKEKDFNLDVAKKVQEILKENNVETKMIRETDTYVDFQQVGSIANDVDTTLFVSIHTNSAVSQTPYGIETWAYLEDDASSLNGMTGKRLAEIIQKELINKTEAEDRGIKNGKSLAVIKTTSMPAVLVEMGFISNAKECEKLMTESYRQKIAEAIADGILLAFDEMGI